MKLRNAICLILGISSLAACSSGGYGSSLPRAPAAYGVQRAHATKQLTISANSCCVIAVDSAIHQIYVSSGVNLSGNNTTVVDGQTFSVAATVSGFGGANNVDSTTHNVWLAGLYAGNVEVYSGLSHSPLMTISLGFCPIGSWIDAKRRYAWVSAQCGAGSDPVWAINADTYAIVAGPIHTGGVLSPITPVDPVTGKLYGTNSSGNFEINPHTFAVHHTAFGAVYNVNGSKNLLYAQVSNALNIVSGRTEKIKKTVPLTYTPDFVGVNSSLDHIYTGASERNFIEVRRGNNGKLLGTIKLKGVKIISVGADDTSSRIYIAGSSGCNYNLYEVADTF